jgi:hypothetical protein
MKNEIKEGDIVDVFIGNASFYEYKVLYMPCATGDSWHLIHKEHLIYVMNFDYMQIHIKSDLPF